MKKCCDTCIYNDLPIEKYPCSLCNYEYDKYMGLTEWLNSFDTNSATKCFEAVNILKQKLEGEDEKTDTR